MKKIWFQVIGLILSFIGLYIGFVFGRHFGIELWQAVIITVIGMIFSYLGIEDDKT